MKLATEVVSEKAGFNSRSAKTGRKRKLLIDAFVASPPEPLRVSEFQTHHGTRLIKARAVSCSDFANSSPHRSSSCKSVN